MESDMLSTCDYKYKYNGIEFQDELGLNMYDMDMRDYDPAIARWVVQDPVVHYDYSPYNAFDNNPVYWADPSGADSETDAMGNAKRDRWGMYIPMNERGSQENSFSFGYDGRRDFLNKNNLYTFKGGEEEEQQTTHWEDKVDKNSEIYKILDKILDKLKIDPNSSAPMNYESIRLLLTSPGIQKLINKSGMKSEVNLLISFGSKVENEYGDIEDGKAWINPVAFTSWSRLALTIIHEGKHMEEFLNKKWDGKTLKSRWWSEVRAWEQSEKLGDRVASGRISKYKRYINIANSNK